MSGSKWQTEDAEPIVDPGAGPPTFLVTMHYLKAALRRRRRVWFGLAVLGLVLGGVFASMIPAQGEGTVSFLLAHPEGADPATAMATDVSMLGTRSVARDVIKELHLRMTPQDFQRSVQASADTNQVLRVIVSAPTSGEAVDRARALSDAFLAFRGEQLSVQSNAVVAGYKRQITSLQNRVDELTKQYDSHSTNNTASSNGSGILTERASLNSQITTLKESVQQQTLQTTSVSKASHVLDQPSAVEVSQKRRTVLAMGSGLIGGLAVGAGLVLFQALTTDRLYRREDVALALTAPVRFSVRGLTRSRWRDVTAPRGRNADDLRVMVHGLTSLVARSGSAVASDTEFRHSAAIVGSEAPSRLALITVDRHSTAERIVSATAVRLCQDGIGVVLVDVTRRGALRGELERAVGAVASGDPLSVVPRVLRPTGLPTDVAGPVGVPVGLAKLETDDLALLRTADTVIVLAEVGPAFELDDLKVWADVVIPLVTAGGCSAERLRTVAELARSSGMDLPYAMMVGTDPMDESLGVPEVPSGLSRDVVKLGQ